MSFHGRVERACQGDHDARTLRVSLLQELTAAVPHDFYAWLLTDPETCVGSDPVAEVPALGDLPALVRLKYLTTINRWTGPSSSTPATLTTATGGDLTRSRQWSELLSRYDVQDVLSVVFRDQYGCWGFLDLWRRDGTFTVAECDLLHDFAERVTTPLRRSLLPTFGHGPSERSSSGGPAVLLLSNEIELLTQTPHTDAYLRELLHPKPADRRYLLPHTTLQPNCLLVKPESTTIHRRRVCTCATACGSR